MNESNSTERLARITADVLAGGKVTLDDALFLADYPDIDALCDAADSIRMKFAGNAVDSCSIVNARSGLCSEDCKWCAQASRHHTGCEVYDFIDEKELMEAARRNQEAGIHRFSLVTSGRAVGPKEIGRFCDMIRKLSEETDLYLCASMGLIGPDEMKLLAEAGVKRYHCNMETASSFFPTLCTSHTPADKARTIRAAREAGLDVCSGGIIGMGETMRQRVEFAFELAGLDVDSVPLNILNPIPGTPLADQPLISEEEIIRTGAVFRFILPDKAIRFAGGRLRLSRESMMRMLRGGINGALMGDMLTTVSNRIADDRRMFADAGLDY
ncbi:MAG: biotin synthase BioB [Muribaculaceae bacterium]|nr:biotin synthase BioB [Muribaculaceae bacterium]